MIAATARTRIRVSVLVATFAAGAFGSTACDNGDATPDWSRMITQPKLQSFGASAMFDDGAAMRQPPAGAIARDWIGDRRRRDGRDARGELVDALPIAVTRAVLDRGRERFEIVCATCHGVAGDGDSAVAHAMQRRRPPSLHEARIIALSPGALYRVIVDGYGLMPAFASMFTVDDRWAVVAYVRTLELAWRADLETLPPAIASDVARRLP